MKNEWYECKVKYQKTLENGQTKKVTETYITAAVSVSDAESRVVKEMAPLINGEFAVIAVKRASFTEIFDSDEERYYQCKVSFTGLTDDGEEKKQNNIILVQAEDFKDAEKRLEQGMKGTMSDWEICSIAETAIIEVFY